MHPPYPKPLLSLVLALQAQHDHVGVHWHDLQLVLFLPHVFLLVHNTAAQQAHVQLRAVIFGRFVALEEKEDAALLGYGVASPAKEKPLNTEVAPSRT